MICDKESRLWLARDGTYRDEPEQVIQRRFQRTKKSKDVEKLENQATANIEVELFSNQAEVSDDEHIELGDDAFNVPFSPSELR